MAITPTNKLVYPLGLTSQSSDTDYLHIAVLKYIPPKTSGESGNFNFTSGDRANRIQAGGKGTRAEGNIFLPIPLNLEDRNAVSWRQSSINSLALDAIETAKGIVSDLTLDTSLEQSITDVKARVKGVLSKYKDTIQDPQVMDSLENFLIGKAVNVAGANVDIQDLISRTQGIVLNPNLELLFKSVQLRQFNYSFNFTPRSRAESNTVKAIIRTFKRRMSSKSTTSADSGRGLFIGAPDVFQLTFMKGREKHPFLNDHKICALTNMSTNYTGTGAYATYEDATPVQINMSLSFNELSPVYFEDYASDSPAANEGVGF